MLVLDRMAREHGRTLALLTGFRTRLRRVLPSDGRTFLFQMTPCQGGSLSGKYLSQIQEFP